mgnify:CR=1 FL=1
MSSPRSIVADLAASLYAGEIEYQEFVASIPPEAEKDREIFQLIDLIEHEPKIGRLFGVSQMDHDLYVADIHTKINALKN